MRPKLIFITGLTASGKSDLALFLAKKIQGQIINADSRQVYKYLDWGSGKIEIGKFRKVKIRNKIFTVVYDKNNNLPHYLISQVNPQTNYSLGKWLSDSEILIKYLTEKKKNIIFCGGTILYLKALKEGWQIPNIKPDWKLRKKLEKKTPQELFNYLMSLDKNRSLSIDKNNKVRLIRAIEIVSKKGYVPQLIKNPKYNLLIIAPAFNWFNLEKKIKRRLKERSFKIFQEIINLRKKGLSFKRIISFGLEYRWFGLMVKIFKLKNIDKRKFIEIQKTTEYQDMFEKCYRDIRRFARKQWRELQKIKEVVWVNNKKDCLVKVKEFFKEQMN